MPDKKTRTPAKTLANAKNLRLHATDAEKLFWAKVRNRQCLGLKFRRQHPIPPYIVDFYCEDRLLVVEIDGGQHNESIDKARTKFLNQKGYRVLRYWNNEVLGNIEGVIENIMDIMNDDLIKNPSPHPSPEGRGSSKK